MELTSNSHRIHLKLMSDHESEAIFSRGSHVLTAVGAHDLTWAPVRRIWTAWGPGAQDLDRPPY